MCVYVCMCVYIYIYIYQFSVHQKLTQHCKFTVLQLKKKFKAMVIELKEYMLGVRSHAE